MSSLASRIARLRGGGAERPIGVLMIEDFGDVLTSQE